LQLDRVTVESLHDLVILSFSDLRRRRRRSDEERESKDGFI
jgi:hypothetical protein